MDLDAYPEWNRFVRRAIGDPVEGERLEVHLEPEGGSTFRIRPRVHRVRPEREFSWRGRLGIPGLFDAEHRFRIEEKGDGEGVRFVHEEDFRGVLVPFVWAWIGGKTRRGFEGMNRALKARVEERSGLRAER